MLSRILPLGGGFGGAEFVVGGGGGGVGGTKNPNSSCGVDGAGGIGVPGGAVSSSYVSTIGEPGGGGGATLRNVALTLSFKLFHSCFIVFSLIARSLQSSGVCVLCVGLVKSVGEVSNDI